MHEGENHMQWTLYCVRMETISLFTELLISQRQGLVINFHKKQRRFFAFILYNLIIKI